MPSFHGGDPSTLLRVLPWALGLTLFAACAEGPRDPPAETPGARVIIPNEPSSLDPRFVTDAWGLRLSRLIFASLVTIDPDTLDVVPDLAASVEVVTPTTYLVTLRPALRFSDGSALTSEDVAATFRGVVSRALGSRYAGTYARIASIEVLDPLRVRFVLDGPHATFLTDLELPIVPAERSERRMAETPAALVGAGPFRLVARANGHLRLEANAHWYAGAPRFDSLEVRVIRDDNTRAMRLLGGAADVAIDALPPSLVPLFEEEGEDLVVRSAPGPGTTYLGFQLEAPPVRDLRVRRAIAHAIDRALLVRAKLLGRGEVASGFMPVGHWAYDPGIAMPAHDPAAARRLLDEAGYPDPPGDAPRLRISLRTSTSRDRVSLARAIAGMLREVGIDVAVRPTEGGSLVADLNSGRYEMSLMELPEVIEPHLLSWFFASDRIPGEGGGGANRFRLRDPALDAALERGRLETARPARRAAYFVAQRRIADTLPAIPLFQEHVIVVTRRGFDLPVPRDGRLTPLAR